MLMPPENLASGKRLVQLAHRLDELDGVVVVLLDAGGDGEDVRIEDDVGRIEADFVDEDVVGARADRHLALDRVGLALLVEGHDDHGRAVAPARAGPARGTSLRLPSGRSS